MRKYLLRYLIFLLPALIATLADRSFDQNLDAGLRPPIAEELPNDQSIRECP